MARYKRNTRKEPFAAGRDDDGLERHEVVLRLEEGQRIHLGHLQKGLEGDDNRSFLGLFFRFKQSRMLICSPPSQTLTRYGNTYVATVATI